MTLVGCAPAQHRPDAAFLPGHLTGIYHRRHKRARRPLNSCSGLNLPDWIFPTFKSKDILQRANEPVITNFVGRTPLDSNSWSARWFAVPWSRLGPTLCHLGTLPGRPVRFSHLPLAGLSPPVDGQRTPGLSPGRRLPRSGRASRAGPGPSIPCSVRRNFLAVCLRSGLLHPPRSTPWAFFYPRYFPLPVPTHFQI